MALLFIMNIDDIKKVLNNKLFLELDLGGKKIYAKSKNKPILKLLKELYSDFKVSELIYLFKNKDNLENLHIFCKICGSKNKFIDNSVGYTVYCSKKCCDSDIDFKRQTIEKTKQSVDENGLNPYKKGAIKANITKFKIGEDGLTSIQRGVKKQKQTKKKKYNDENYNNRKKSKETCSLKYGVDNPRKCANYIDKRNKHDLEKYGVPYFTNREKATNTMLTKIDSQGLNGYQQNANKIKKHFLNTIGVSQHMLMHLNHKEDINDYSFRKLFISGGKFDVDKCCDYFNAQRSWVYAKKKEFNILEPTKQKQELLQFEIYKFLRDIYNDIILFNSRQIISPLELDIYIPKKKLAIEFNGIYWHSINIGMDKNYHQNKSKMCKEKGIRLIHIYEDEWNDEHKREIIKDIVKHALNIPVLENKIFARKCIIKEIQNDEYNAFCNKYHIQGTKQAQIKLGLFYNNKLVQIASFNKSRYDKRYEWEWIRGCPASNNNVIGGTSKLFKYFVRKYSPKSVLCYADFNKFDGKGYKECGFNFDTITIPDKFYFDIKNNKRVNRNPNKYREYKELVKNNKFLLLYGAGNLKFVWFNTL